MANLPEVTVGPPDDLGWRKVSTKGKCAGKVRSPGELRRFLQRAGLKPEHPVHWLGGDSLVWPDRTAQRRIVGSLMCIGFLLTAVLLLRIGWMDSQRALTFGERLAGYSVLAAGLVELIAALATLDYWHQRKRAYSGPLLMAGVGIVFLCSSSLLFLQIGERFTGWSVIGISFLTGSILAGVELVKLRAWKGLRYPGRIAIGAIVPALLAGINLAYTQLYVPTVTAPLIMSGAEFKEASLDSARSVLHVTVHAYVRNNGSVPVYILGSIYWVHGGPANDIHQTTDPSSSFKLIYDGEFVTPAGRELDPGEEISQDAVIDIKDPDKLKLDYEILRTQTEIYAIRRDRMTLPPEYGQSRSSIEALKRDRKWSAGEPGNAIYRDESNISNSSEILNIARGRQSIRAWKLSFPNWSRIELAITPPGGRITFDPHDPHYRKQLIDRYGLSLARGSMDQTPFKMLLEKARAAEKHPAPEQSGQ
ncbi:MULTISPECIES: hypothetical protein [Streptomyces]|uniref:hypothetical protein n=1 Tax=Streptomyces TaxID=1883 RepID=UPI000F50EC95|nr:MULTISPECIES: hypothetical protein [Streptomyces]